MKVLIIGAGILGASTAYHLSRQAGIDVEIVDANHQGKATLAGAGIICPWATLIEDEDFYNLYAAGARYYATLVEDLRQNGVSECGYVQVGGLVVAEEEEAFDQAFKRIIRRTTHAPEAGKIERISSRAAIEKFPPLREGMEAIFIPGAARVEARVLSNALLHAAHAQGARIVQDRVFLERQGERVLCRARDGTVMEADEIIVTAGVWAAEILRPLGISHPVVPQKGQIIHLHLPHTQTAHWPVLLPVGAHYLLAFDDSRVVIGATREDRSGFDTRVTAAGVHEVLHAGLAVAPGLAHATLMETRVGLRPATAHMRPILGRVAGIKGLILGNGLGAAGLTIGPFAGKILADIVTCTPAEIDLVSYLPLL